MIVPAKSLYGLLSPSALVFISFLILRVGSINAFTPRPKIWKSVTSKISCMSYLILSMQKDTMYPSSIHMLSFKLLYQFTFSMLVLYDTVFPYFKFLLICFKAQYNLLKLSLWMILYKVLEMQMIAVLLAFDCSRESFDDISKRA